MPNPVVHFEIGGADGVALQQFYAAAFDWNVNAENPMQYGLVEAQTRASAAASRLPTMRTSPSTSRSTTCRRI